MNKAEIAMLGNAFNIEINAALTGAVPLMQSRSKVAQKLVDEGLLERASYTLNGRFPVTIDGLQLTHAGRLYYCSSCEDEA